MGTGKHIERKTREGDTIYRDKSDGGSIAGGPIAMDTDGGGSVTAPAFGPWRKSSRSGPSGTCVETASARGHVAVRDSKDRTGPVLGFSPVAWTRFVEEIKNGAYEG